MQYGTIPGVERPVSRILFGTATPILFNAFRSVYGEAPDFPQRLNAAFDLLDTMYALGINAFDCADHYGEEPLGEWLEARGLHDKCVILTKGAHHNRWRKRVTDFDILYDCHNSLAKLKTSHIQLYLLHRDDPQVPVGPIMETLNRLHAEGKIGVFGASNWTMERMMEANEYAYKHGLVPFTVSSPNFGLANQLDDPWGGGCVTISGPKNRTVRAWYRDNHIPIMAYSALGRGFFSGAFRHDQPEKAAALLDQAARKGYDYPENYERLRRCEILAQEMGVSVSQIAMAWIFNQPGLEVYALSGATSKAHMQANIDAADIRLTPRQCEWLDLERENC